MMMLTQVNTNWFATAVGHRPIMAAGFPNDDTVPGGAQSAIRVFVVEDEAVISLDLCERLTSDRKSTRLNSSHIPLSRMPSSA